MTPNDLCDRLKRVAVLWRTGTCVWHRANGARGVVIGYAVNGQGCVYLRVVFADGMDDCMPDELSPSKIVLDDDKEGWQNAGDNDDDL